MPFQSSVNYNWAAGFPGRWASQNPRRTVIPGPNGFRAGVGGLLIARFAWIGADGTTLSNAQTTGAPAGFVYADQQGLTTAYLQESTMTLPAGFMAQLAEGGDVWATSSTAATNGQKVFASTTDGSISTGDAGATVDGHIETAWKVSQGNAAGSPIIITGPVAAA